MPYNPYLTNPYTGQYYNMPQAPQVQQPIQQPVQQPQIQNGGFMSVPSEDIARSYPVAPGNCVTFKIEGKPIVMEKSMGFSQLDAPRIDRYRLVKEETQQEAESDPVDITEKYVLKTDYESLKEELESVRNDLETIKSQIQPKRKTKKETEDEES